MDGRLGGGDGKGTAVEQPLLSFVRDQQVVLEHLGLTLAEGKRLLQEVQQRMVAAQVKRHGAVYRRCGYCKRKLSTKGYQRRWFRSVFGRVPIRVRRLTTCPSRIANSRAESRIGQRCATPDV